MWYFLFSFCVFILLIEEIRFKMLSFLWFFWSLKGKVVIVIGVGSFGDDIGNGWVIVILFVEDGVNVVCVDWDM